MSESNQDTNPDGTTEAAAPKRPAEAAPQKPAEAAKAPARGGKWRRRFRRLAIVLVIGLLLFRLALSVLLPTVVHRAARAFGFDLSYGRLDLNLLGTQAGIWDVTLRAKDRPDNILHADYAFANISSLALFKLKLRAYRLEVDGVQVALLRKPDGTVPLLEQLAAALKSTEPPPPAEPLRFDSPLAVEALRVNHVKLAVRDESVSPPYDDTFTLGLRVSDVGNPGRPATLEVDVFSRSMLQALRLQGQADLKPDTLNATVTFSMFGLRLNDARAYLASLGFRAEDLPIALTGAADVSLKALPAKPGALSGVASVRDVRLTAGQEDAVRLARCELAIKELSPSSLHVSRVRVDGGLLTLRRADPGLVSFASLSPLKRAAPPPASAPATAPAAAPTTSPAGAPFSWRVDEVVAAGLVGEFRDDLVAPALRFAAKVGTFEIKNLAGAGAKEDAATLKLVFEVPDVAANVQVVGTAKPFADPPAVAIELDASGVGAAALRPYCAPLGIEPTLRSGRFHASVEASAAPGAGGAPAVTLTLRDVRLDEGNNGLLDMPSVRVAGLRRDPATGAVHIDDLAASGPSLTVRRIDERTVELPGFRYRRITLPPVVAEAEAVKEAVTGRPGILVAPIPAVHIGKLSWGEANVRLEDRSTEGLEPIELTEARLDVEGLLFDLRPDGPPMPPGKISGRFRSPGVAEGVRIDGTLTPGRGSLAADLSLAGTGLNLARLSPYLKPFGVEPRLADGSFKATVRASVSQVGETVRLAADARDVELKGGDVRLLALERASADAVEVSAAGYQIGNISVSKPYARVERDADGGLIAGGVKLLPAPPTTQPAAPGTQPATQPAVAATQPAVDPFALLASLPPVGLNSLKVDGAELDWLDRAAPAPVELKVSASGSLESVALNQPQPRTGKYELLVSVPKVAERVHLAGTIDPGPDSFAAVANVEAAGLSPGGLAAYLPEGIQAAMSGGAFKTSAAVTVARHPDGGVKGTLAVTALSLKDEAAGPAPLAALDALNVGLDRLDLSTGDMALSTFSVTGAEATLSREADGALALLGLRIAAAPQPPPQAGQPPAAAAPPAPEAPPVDVREIVAQSKRALPFLSLETLDLRLKRVSFQDNLRKAAPVALTDFRVFNDGPIRLLGPRPESNPPATIRLAGAVEPVAKHVDVAAQAAPFAQRPTAKVSVEVTGIDGDALTRVAPELAETLDGSGLADGRFKTTFEAEANVRRRGPTQIDLSRGFEVTSFSLTQTAFRDGESGPVLGGVGSVRGEQVKVETRTGDVTVRSLEINDLAANAWRDAKGIYVLGMRIKGTEAKPDKSDETPKPQPEPDAIVAAHTEAAATVPAAADPKAPKPEVRIERLTVSGLDFRFEDRALDPPVLIPITSLDAEVRGLSSLMLERERPAKFNVSLGAGKVSLPKKLRGGVLTGALADLGHLAGGKRADTTPELEERDFFAQIVAAGSVKLYPKPAGRAQASVNGIELAAIRGLAAPTGILLNGGTFDGRIDMKTRDDDKLDVRSRFVLTDLSITEPPNGPIVRYLGLPAPLDVVIGAAEAPDKSITLPLHFQVDGATPEGIGPAAAGAVSRVLVTAVASAPVKTVTRVVGLFGNTTREMEVVEDPPVYLEFAPGLTSLDPASGRALAALLARAKRDKNTRMVIDHELGQDDVAVAARRANPPAQQVSVFAENLRVRRRDLIARRDDLLSPATGAALSGAANVGARGEAMGAYRGLHRELADVEDAMDRLYDLQRPGAERQADRRTRAAAQELAEARLARVRAGVKLLGDAAAAERVRVGVARFAPGDQRPSRLVVNVARAVPKSKSKRSGGTAATARAQ